MSSLSGASACSVTALPAAGQLAAPGREIEVFAPAALCSACGVKDGPKPLHVRTWQCRACGAWLTGTSTRRSTSPGPPDWR